MRGFGCTWAKPGKVNCTWLWLTGLLLVVGLQSCSVGISTRGGYAGVRAARQATPGQDTAAKKPTEGTDKAELTGTNTPAQEESQPDKRMAWPKRNGLSPKVKTSAVREQEGHASAASQEQRPLSVEDPHGLFSDFHELKPYLEGVSSWYGPNFHGKPTANGEKYNQFGLTAAHPMLPLGTRIEVENMENSRKVWVRVNDRGPYAKGRILDLSRAAAERLDMVRKGTAPVRIRITRWPKTVDTVLGLKAYRQYVVQVAAYPGRQTAEAQLLHHQERFTAIPFRLDRVPNAPYTIIAGPYETEALAWRDARHMQGEGVTSLVRRYRK